MQNIIHYADIIAIPMFILLSIYFINKKNKTSIENILMLFAICGAIIDSYFTCHFLNKN
jgi:hypothetical protein